MSMLCFSFGTGTHTILRMFWKRLSAALRAYLYVGMERKGAKEVKGAGGLVEKGPGDPVARSVGGRGIPLFRMYALHEAWMYRKKGDEKKEKKEKKDKGGEKS